MMNLLNTEGKPVILSLHGICYGIIIFCFLKVSIITPNHIKDFQNITNPPNFSAILCEDYIMHEKFF